MKPRCLLLLSLAVLVLAACGTTSSGDWPEAGTLIPRGTVRLSPNVAYSYEVLAGAAAFYAIYDPLAPNWSIKEKALSDEVFYLALRAKSFRIGGDGEAMLVFRRRALQLQREKGFASYRILDFSEGIESSTPLTQRYSEGTIQLVRADPGTPATPK